MVLRRIVCAVICLLFGAAAANEQHFPDRQWSRMQIPGFEIIYPTGQDREARHVAERLTTYWPELRATLPLEYRQRVAAPRRIPILLSTPTLVSNGKVAYDPFRSEYFNQPSPVGGLEWFDLLSVHEGRHLVQVLQPLDTLTGQVAFVLAGEMGPASIVALFYPSWLLEGDAVLEETRLTGGGRGRMASFDLWLRTHELTRSRYSYQRAMLGTGYESYPFVSPYDLGYFLTTHLRREYGNKVLDTALRSTAAPGRGFSLDGVVENLTGHDLRATYHNTWDELRRIWLRQQAALSITEVEVLWRPGQDHWHSLYPVAVDGDTVMAVAVDVRTGSHLVSVTDGRIRRLTTLPRSVAAQYYGTAKQRAVSYAAGRFCWTEPRPHPRFARETGRDIHCYRVATDTTRRLTRDGQYTSVALSRDGQSMLAHRFTERRTSQLRLLDSGGRPIGRLELPDRSLAYDLSQSATGAWVFVLLDGDGARFMVWDAAAQAPRPLTEPVLGETLRSPQWLGDWLLYTSDRSGIDSLWALNPDSGERHQVGQRPFGSYFVSPDATGARLVMSDYGPNGHSLVALPWSDAMPRSQRRPAGRPASRPTRYSAPLHTAPLKSAPADARISPYRRAAHALDVNHWLLLADDQAVKASVHANNLLNTVTLDAFAGIARQAERPIAGATLHWRRWWPVLSAGAERTYINGDDFLDSRAHLSASVPLRFNRGPWSTSVEPFTGLSLTQRNSMNSEARITSTLVSGGLRFGHAHQRALRDLQPPWAYYQETALDWERQTESTQVYNRARVNLPGLRANHHLTLDAQVQRRPERFRGRPRLAMPGALMDTEIDDDAWSARTQYRFNLGPVDASVGRLWYLRSLELGIEAQAAGTAAGTEWALGSRLTIPSNLLRNSMLRVDPSVSLFYRPERDDFLTLFSVSLGVY